MLIAPYGKWDARGSYFAADQRTAAAAHSSKGHHINVALRPAPPPALLSHVCLHFPHGVSTTFSTVVAAHGDSFLVNIVTTNDTRRSDSVASDYFIYNTGDHARRRPPTLSLLPRYGFTKSTGRHWLSLNRSATGLLRRGESELVVAELRMIPSARFPMLLPRVPELLLFHGGAGEWRVVQPQVVHGLHGKVWDLILCKWEEMDAVVPLGDDGILCWVSFDYGLLVADVFDERPTLRYVPYPVQYYSYMCIAAGGVVKLLDVYPMHMRTWTLRTDGMAWAVDVDDSAEPWSLTRGKGYARMQLVYPVASTNGGRRVLSGEKEHYD